jgi:3-oxoadipate enol-lactonase
LAEVRTEAIDIAGRRLAWRSIGRGAPLLLVNGYAATASDWDPDLISALASSFQVICPDHRGMGGSDLGDPAHLTIGGMAADLERLLDALEIDRAWVAGWSMGGFVTQRLSTRAPGRVEAMALLSTDPGGSAATRAEPGVWTLLTDRSGTPREQASRLISLLFPPSLAPDIDNRFGEMVAAARAQLSPAALSAQESAMEDWYGEERPSPGATAPRTVAVCGAEDVVIPPENSDALGALWPDCRVERIAGAGHAFMAQEPEWTANLLENFLLET